MRAVAVQLMEVVYGVKDNEWLVKLLRGMISGPGAGDKQKKVPVRTGVPRILDVRCGRIVRIDMPRVLDVRCERIRYARRYGIPRGTTNKRYSVDTARGMKVSRAMQQVVG